MVLGRVPVDCLKTFCPSAGLRICKALPLQLFDTYSLILKTNKRALTTSSNDHSIEINQLCVAYAKLFCTLEKTFLFSDVYTPLVGVGHLFVTVLLLLDVVKGMTL